MPRVICSFVLILILVNGSADAQTTAPFVRTIVVSPVPGDAQASGQALLSAVASISASSSNRWLVKVEPGIFDIGVNFLEMKPWVDIEGSGIDLTAIQGLAQPNINFLFTRGTVIGANHSELRNLRVKCVTSSSQGRAGCIAMANAGSSPRVTRVRLVSKGFGSHWGMRNTGADPELRNVEMVISGGYENYGIVNAAGSLPVLEDVDLKVTGGTGANIGMLNREDGIPVSLNRSSLVVVGGAFALGIFDLTPSSQPGRGFPVFNTGIVARDASKNIGISQGNRQFSLKQSTVEGAQAAVDLGDFGSLIAENSVLQSDGLIARAAQVLLGSVSLRGSGDVLGAATSCLGVFRLGVEFSASTCPAPTASPPARPAVPSPIDGLDYPTELGG